tara:strand:+ start:81 stop:404 length:324 start_codon:yes stop_codon:yes gene_type:complete
MAFFIKQNDTSPALEATLKDGLGAVVNLTGCSVRFHMRLVGGNVAKTDAPATLSVPLGGVVYYQWNGSDTDTIGSYEAEFEVTFIGGEIETFPNNKYIEVEITDDIA